MSGDPSTAQQDLSDRVQKLSRRGDQMALRRDMLARSLDTYQREIEDLRDRSEVLQKVSELFQMLLDQLVNQQVQAVQQVVTDGLRAIFHDLDLTFEAVVSSKHNRAWVDFYLRQGTEGDPSSHRAKPLEGFGGGPSSVASLILRVLTMLRLKRAPLLLLDETLGAVSEEYVDRTGQFLSKLAEDAGVNLLLVTHKPSFLDHANQAYRCFEVVDNTQRHLGLKESR
jgi:chromosome segregation ATPase